MIKTAATPSSRTITPDPRSQPYCPYGAARTLWRSRAETIVLAGPSHTGKSRGCLEKLHYCADKYPHARMLMLRKVRNSLNQTAIVTYEQKVLPAGYLDDGGPIHFNTNEQQYEYPNGSIIAIGGMDKASKHLSSEWDMIYCQELTEFSENDFEILDIRCRNHVMPYQQLLGDCNPDVPTHWLKLRAEHGLTRMIDSHHEDNPSLRPEDLARLQRLTGVRLDRYYKGLLVAAEGMVFDEWSRKVHMATRDQLTAWGILHADGTFNRSGVKRVIAGVDWGYSHPGCLRVEAIDGDGRFFTLREIYQTQRTDSWWIERGLELKSEYGIEVFVADPSQPAYIEKFNAAGLPTIKAVNDIAPGLSACHDRLAIAGDGRPRYYYYEYAMQDRDMTLVETHKPFWFPGEIEGYVWPKSADGRVVKEVPVKEHDHALDCWRYVSMYLSTPHAARVWSPKPRIVTEAAPFSQRAAIARPRPGSVFDGGKL